MDSINLFKLFAYDLLRSVYRLMLAIIGMLQSDNYPVFSCKIQNLFCFLIRSDARFSYHTGERVYRAFPREKKSGGIYFCHQNRGFQLYCRGVSGRLKTLGESYFINLIDIRDGDVVIDCGANYGDVFAYLKSNHPVDFQYVGLEPSPSEFSVLEKNVVGGVVLQKGLSNESGRLSFYISSGTADSSLIEPPSYSERVDVDVISLSELFVDLKIDRCRLFKLEAEGFEPEILDGAAAVLPMIDYISIDGGPERGMGEEKTFCNLANKLLDNDFEMVDINGPQYRALFRNKSLFDAEC